MKKILLGIIITLLLLFIAVIIYILYIINTEKSFNAFSLDDPKTSYTIEGIRAGQYINYFVVNKERIPPAPFSGEATNKAVLRKAALIGNSKVDIEGFVGKNIRIKGSYKGRIATQQCIVDKCHLIGNSSVIDIDDITLVSN